MLPEQAEGRLLGPRFEARRLGSENVFSVDLPEDSNALAPFGREGDGGPIPLFGPDGHVAAEAGETDDGRDEVKDAADVLDRHDLPVVMTFHAGGDGPGHKTTDNGRQAVELLKRVNAAAVALRADEKRPHAVAALEVAEQVLGMVLGLEGPGLSLAVVVAELAHGEGRVGEIRPDVKWPVRTAGGFLTERIGVE